MLEMFRGIKKVGEAAVKRILNEGCNLASLRMLASKMATSEARH